MADQPSNAEIMAAVKSLHQKVDAVDTALRGSADGTVKGVLARVAANEQRLANVARFLWIVISAAVGAIGTAATACWAWVTKGGGGS